MSARDSAHASDSEDADMGADRAAYAAGQALAAAGDRVAGGARRDLYSAAESGFSVECLPKDFRLYHRARLVLRLRDSVCLDDQF